MSEPKHTPGPWRLTKSNQFSNSVEGQSGRLLYEGDTGWRTVASFQDCCESHDYTVIEENAAANGRLIAAAPELLAELESLLPWMEAAIRAGCQGKGGEPNDDLADHAVANHERLRSAKALIARIKESKP